MSNFFQRNVQVIIGSRRWNNPPLDIDFNVKFDTDSIPDEAEVSIFNISQDSINSINRGMNITVNAGYGMDLGTILNGVVTSVETTRNGLDFETKIKALNVTSQYVNKAVTKTYKGDVKASFIISDLLLMVGIRPNKLDLQEDHLYKRGFIASGKIKDIVSKIAIQCKSRLIIRNTAILITRRSQGTEDGFVLNSKTGLIDVQKIDKQDGVSTHKITALLNHAINPYTILKVESSKLNGMVLVVEGEHKGDFTTEIEVRVL